MKHLAIAMGIVTSLAAGLASAEVFGPVAYDAKSEKMRPGQNDADAPNQMNLFQYRPDTTDF